MAGDYPIKQIGDLAASISETHDFGKEQLIFLNTSDILHGKILHRTYSPVKNWPGQAKKSIRKDDILFSEIRPANGRWAYVEEQADDFVVSTKLMVIRAKCDVLYPKFLYQYLTSSEITKLLQHLAESRSGTFPQITFDQVASLELPLPPLPYQKAIATVVGALNDKIELNHQMNETLEALVQTLFNSWFLDAAATKLPKGWSLVPLPEAIEVNPTRLLRKGEVAPYLDMSNMPTRSARALDFIDREFGSGMRFMNGDTLVARITPCLENGKTCFVDFLDGNEVGWGSTEYIVLRPKRPLPVEFAYFLARTDTFRTFAISNMTGTTGRQRVPAECLNNFTIAVPTADLAERFGEFAKSVFAQIKSHDAESRTLAELRDALLPKLLSGELRIQNTEAFLPTQPKAKTS